MEHLEGLNHIAIIPDGNRRWATLKGLPRINGHLAGAERMHDIVAQLIDKGLDYLTIWGFSSDNWKRSQEEIETIFRLTEEWIQKETPWLHKNSVKLKHIGRLHELPESLQAAIAGAIYLTSDNKGLTLLLAFNYSGRVEIVDALRRLIADGTPRKPVNESIVSHYLYTSKIPDVDLVIRTADEFRLSNFMLWQTAYAEFYFTPVFWPDFDTIELEKALKAYAERNRRFGGD